MRIRGRVDENQKQIVQALRKIGYSVAITSNIGSGFPDIIVGFLNKNFLFEIKDPNKTPSQRRLTKEETEFKNSWRGQYHVIHSFEEAKNIIDKYLG